MTDPSETEATPENPERVASLEHITGPARGTVSWLSGSAVDIIVRNDQGLLVVPASSNSPPTMVARLHASGLSYELETCPGQDVWINRNPVADHLLVDGDLVEFGDTGPLCRFRLIRDGSPVSKTLGGAIHDYLDYSRVSRKPALVRFSRAVKNLFTSLTRRTIHTR